MKPKDPRAAMLVAFLGTAFAGAQEPRDIPTFTSKVELVTVDAVVVDGKGRPVRGLKKEDFTLLEDGKPQALASFEAFDLGDAPEVAPGGSAPSTVATNQRPARAGARSFVLLVDDMSLAPTRQEVVRSAIARFLEVGLRDGDELIFATTSGDAWWSARMPEGREDVAALAARVRGKNLGDTAKDAVSDWEAYRINRMESPTGAEQENSGSRPPTQGPPTGGPTSAPGSNITDRVVQRWLDRGLCSPMALQACYHDVRGQAGRVDSRRVNRTRDAIAAVDRAIFALTGVRGRKALLLLTEGFLNDSDLGIVQEVAGRCREANLVVYSLDVRGLMTGMAATDEQSVPNTAEMVAMQVEQTELVAAGSVGLAEDTGGFAVRNTNDLAGGAARVADESRTYYLLGYAPPEGKGPRDWRKLKVEVKTRGLEVRARRGYTLRTSAEIAAAADAASRPKAGKDKASKPADTGTPAAARLPTEMARALATAHDADAIPLRAMPYSLDDRPAGAVRTLVAIEADMRALANLGGEEHPRMVLSLSITATHRDTGKTQRLDQRIVVDTTTLKAWEGWLALSREFDLPPGVAQARVVVRDEFLGRLGALTLRFVVPPSGGLRLSTPLLTDRLSTPSSGKPAHPVPVAHRQFAAGALYCQFQVFGAGATNQGVEASYELRHRDGDVVRTGPATPIAPSPDGRHVRLLALNLDDMAQGDYELVLRVEDKSTGETRERVEPLRIAARS